MQSTKYSQLMQQHQVEKGNKAAGTRARKSALEISKLMKEFRKVSVDAAK